MSDQPVLKAKSHVCAINKNNCTVPARVEPTVPFWRSKTLWSVILYVSATKLFPSVRNWIDSHEENFDVIVGVFLIILRNFSTGKIDWKVKDNKAIVDPE